VDDPYAVMNAESFATDTLSTGDYEEALKCGCRLNQAYFETKPK